MENFGKLKRFDERENFINKLIKNFPNLNYNILGMSNEPQNGIMIYKELSKCVL